MTTHASEPVISPEECTFLKQYNSENGPSAFQSRFLRMAFKDDLCWVGAKPQSCNAKLRKRLTDYSLSAYGTEEIPEGEVRDAIGAVLIMLQTMNNSLTPIDVSLGRGDGFHRIDILFGTEPNDDIPENRILDLSLYRSVYASKNAPTCGAVIEEEENGEIKYAQIYVRTDRIGREISKCVKQAWFKSMGLDPGALENPDLFHDGVERRVLKAPYYDVFSFLDVLSIGFLYQPELSGGESFEEAKAALNAIADDRCG